MRLIDAEALKKALINAHINMVLTFDISTFNCVMNTIDNAPTVDISKEVWNKSNELLNKRLSYLRRTQGEWIFKHGSSDVWCSVCDISLESNLCEGIKFRFCPNCGADMRKGGAEE